MRFIRKLMVAALAVVAAVGATTLVTAAPAQAGEPRCIVVGIDRDDDYRPIWICLDIPILWDKWWWIDGCPDCGPAFDPQLDWIKDPAQRIEINELLGQSVLYSAGALFAEDPKQAELFRRTAAEAGLRAAEILGEEQLEIEQVGWADMESGKFIADDNELLVYAGDELAAAATSFQKALGEPSPTPMIEEGLAHLEQVAESLTELNHR